MTGSRRPALAIGLLVAALAMAAMVIAAPVLWALQTHRDISGRQSRLDTLTQALASGAGLPEASAAGWFVGGGASTGRAAAELQLKIAAAAKAHGVTVRSTQVLAPKREGDLTQIAVEVSFQAGAAALRDLVHTLETGVPILILDEINIRALPPQAGSSARSVMLDTSMKVDSTVYCHLAPPSAI